MPIPIRPIGDQSNNYPQDSGSQFLMMNLDALATVVNTGFTGPMNKSSGIQVNAEATDLDAEILLDLWNRGKIVTEAATAEDKKYAVPEGFGNDDLMRLKAASLVHGDSNTIKFTSKAIRVIKTVVLSEQNVFAKGAIKKPYSVILAENKHLAATRSTLAFERTASVAPIVQLAQRNIEIDDAHMPQRGTPVIQSSRLVKREGSANKQYIVRMYEVNGEYSVLAWNGRNEPGRGLTMQPKGSFRSRSQAQSVFDDLTGSKSREGYTRVSEISHPDLLGSLYSSREDRSDTERATTRPIVPPTPARRSTPRTEPARSEPVSPPASIPASPPSKIQQPVKPKENLLDNPNLDDEIASILGEDEEFNF